MNKVTSWDCLSPNLIFVKPTYHLNTLISFQNCALALQARWCSVASWSLLWFITDWASLCFDMTDSDPKPQSVWLAVFIPGWAALPLAFTHTWTYLQTNTKRHTHMSTHRCVHADPQSTKLLGWTRWRWTSVKNSTAIHHAEVYFWVICVGWWVFLLWNYHESVTLAILILLWCVWLWLCADWHLNR